MAVSTVPVADASQKDRESSSVRESGGSIHTESDLVKYRVRSAQELTRGKALRTLADVVADALGSSDPDEVKRIVDTDESAVLARLATGYRKWQRPPAPKKRPDDFVPGWRLDSTSLGNAWGNDVYFVLRAILYAHRVALVDPVWFHMHPLGGSKGPWGGHGFREALAKVLIYAPLERARLLFYVPPGMPPEPDSFFATEYVDEVLEAYFRDYLAPQGIYIDVAEWDWGRPTGKAWLARLAANNELAFGLHGATTLLQWQRANAHSVDLYVPEGTMFRNALEWLIRGGGHGLLTGKGDTRDSQALSALWKLPTPSIERYQELTIADLLLVRQENAFTVWREALTSALEAFVVSKAVDEDPKAVTAFAVELEARRTEAVAAVGSTKLLKDMTGAAGTFGLSAFIAAGVSMSMQSDPWVGTISSAAGAAAAATPKTARVVRALATHGSRKRAMGDHFRLFGTS